MDRPFNPESVAEVVVRQATASDLDEMVEFLQPFVEAGKILERTPEELASYVNDVFLAEVHDRIVGCAALEVYNRKLAEVRGLAVAPEMQGRGVGKLLVSACVERARARKVLEVMAITSSEDFFKSCGFDFTLPGEKKALFIYTRED